MYWAECLHRAASGSFNFIFLIDYSADFIIDTIIMCNDYTPHFQSPGAIEHVV